MAPAPRWPPGATGGWSGRRRASCSDSRSSAQWRHSGHSMPFSGQGEVDAPVAGPGEHPVSRVGMRRAVVLGAIATAVGIGRIWMIRSVFLFLDLDVYRIAVRAWMGGKDLYGVL